MRGYQCHYYRKIKNKFDKNTNNACWAGLYHWMGEDNIYITEYVCEETEKYIPLLIKLINKITPCKLGENKTIGKYIKFTLLGDNYDRNLILLNFIRYLWNSPLPKFHEVFFKYLKEADLQRDPLEILTSANKEASKPYDRGYQIGHSNVITHTTLKIKTTQQLKDFNGTSTYHFLTK